MLLSSGYGAYGRGGIVIGIGENFFDKLGPCARLLGLRPLTTLSLSFLVGCAVSGPMDPIDQVVRESRGSSVTDPDISRESKGLHAYMLGQLLYGKEEFRASMAYFQEASTNLKDEAPSLRIRLAELALRDGNLELAYQESAKALAARPDDPAVITMHAGVLDAQGKPDEALVLYEKLLVAHPEATELYLVTSGLYLRQGRGDEAVALLSKLAKLSPNEPAVHLFLGRAYEQIGDFDNSFKSLRAAWDVGGGNPRIGLELVRALLARGHEDEARIVCEDILRVHPEHIEVRRVLGMLLAGEKKWDEALSHLKIVEGSERDATETRFQIALLHLENKRFPEAESELSLVLASSPTHAEARFYRATVYAGTGRYEEAMSDFLEVPSSSPLFDRSRTIAALLARQNGDIERAEKIVREAVDDAQDKVELRHYLVSILREAGKLDEAVDEAEALVALRPKDTKLLFDYGMVLFEDGQVAKSEYVMQRVLQIDPEHPEALNYLAYSFAEDDKQLDEALTMVRRALVNKPEDPYFLDTLGWILFKKDDFSGAKEALEQAVAVISPEDPVILHHLGEAYLALNDVANARRIFVKALELVELNKKGATKELQDLKQKLKMRLESLPKEGAESA